MMRTGPSSGDYGVMRGETTAKQLQNWQVNVQTAALLTRIITPGLVKRAIESIELAERIQARRMSTRKRRMRRTLRIGAYAVGLATAGVAVARMARHSTEPGDRAPDVPATAP
jgi:hypothetical protein